MFCTKRRFYLCGQPKLLTMTRCAPLTGLRNHSVTSYADELKLVIFSTRLLCSSIHSNVAPCDRWHYTSRMAQAFLCISSWKRPDGSCSETYSGAACIYEAHYKKQSVTFKQILAELDAKWPRLHGLAVVRKSKLRLAT